jgi:hypothetical protein
VSALYVSMQIVGSVLCLVAFVWAVRTRHQRHVWRDARHDTSTAAIVLGLEEKVRELEKHSRTTIDAR